MKNKGSITLLWVLLLAACGGGGGTGPAEPEPPLGLASRPALSGLHFPDEPVGAGDVRFTRAFPGLSFGQPMVYAQAPGDASRVYVATKGGRIHVFENRADVTTGERSLFLDISDRTRSEGEQGLLGFAFDPDFSSNGYLYVYYSANANPDVDAGDSVIARFHASSPTAADRDSQTVLLRYTHPFNNHNGGTLAFGPDGMLYVSSGDGGPAGDPNRRAQNLRTPLGKVLRIRPDGGIPADNPFVGVSGTRGEIWAYGFRNPFRMSFDRGSGQLWLGDVGQGTWEEIDVVQRGGNFGWRLREGAHDYNTSDPRPAEVPLIDPISEYGHEDDNCAIVGGVVYRGRAIPGLAGQYLYADFCTGTVWALSHENGTRPLGNRRLGNVPTPSGFYEDAEGEVYISSLDGSIYSLRPNGGGGGGEIPALLSETGLFSNTRALIPNPGLVEYEINAPFWSDGTRKRRWFGIPAGVRIGFSSGDQFQWPPGAVTVKHFEVSRMDGSTRRLETRVMIRSSTGWQGYTYKWNAAETDAELLDDAEIETLTVRTDSGALRTQDYEYPSRVACFNCHTAAAGIPLGLRSAQLNREHLFGTIVDNQLRAYNGVGLFDRNIGAASQYAVQVDPADATAELSARARSYLDANCSQCHRPEGPTGVDMDLRRDTPAADTRTRNVAPSYGDLGIADARRIVPGDKARSLIWERMRRLDGNRMPPVASHVVDEAGVALIGQWIDAGAN